MLLIIKLFYINKTFTIVSFKIRSLNLKLFNFSQYTIRIDPLWTGSNYVCESGHIVIRLFWNCEKSVNPYGTILLLFWTNDEFNGTVTQG